MAANKEAHRSDRREVPQVHPGRDERRNKTRRCGENDHRHEKQATRIHYQRLLIPLLYLRNTSRDEGGSLGISRNSVGGMAVLTSNCDDGGPGDRHLWRLATRFAKPPAKRI